MRHRLFYCLCPALLASLASSGQESIHNAADYDAWKQKTYHVINEGHGVQNTFQGTGPVVHETRGGGLATCDCWVQPASDYTTIDNDSQWDASGYQNADDGSYGPINLPFQFYLYGTYFDQIWINTNGNITVGNFMTGFTASGFPTTPDRIIGAFWADVDLRGPGATNNIVQYRVTPTALYVNWTNVGYYSMMVDKVNTFQIIITDGTDPIVPNGANVSFCYKDMQWTTGSANSGVGGFGGNPANVGANQGNGVDYLQFGRFDHAGTDYDGPFGNADGISFLDDQYFSFATDITLANVPPVVSGQSVCDTVVLCVGETTQLDVTFLSPEPDQTTVPTASCSTLSDFNIISATSGVNADISVALTPTNSEVGYHIVTFEGTDNGVPVVTSTLNVVVWVQIAAILEPGELTVCDTDDPVDMYTLLGGQPVPGGEWTDPNGLSHNGQFLPGEDPVGAYIYSVGIGTNCPATGTVTMSTAPHADAGSDGTLAKCSSDAAVGLFQSLGGTPQATGFWLAPNMTTHSGRLQPSTDLPGIYRYVVDAPTPCPTDTSSISVAIPQAVHPGTDAAIALCANADPLFMRDALNGSPDASGAWTDPGGVAFGDTFTVMVDLPGTYTYTVPATLPCPTLSAALSISVDPLPDAGENAELAVCADASPSSLFAVLGGTPDDGGQWLDPFGAEHSGTLDPSLRISGKYTYVAIGPGTCAQLSDSSFIAVVVDPLPVVSFTVDPDSGCHPLRVNFTNTTDPVFLGNSCVWSLGDGTDGLMECGSFEHVYEEPGWYNVKLTITTPEGCTDHTIVQGAVLVDPAPEAVFDWTPNPGTGYNSDILFSALDPNAVEWHWTFDGVEGPAERQTYHYFQHVLGDEYEVCLSVADRYGCADSLCETVRVVVPALYAPNAFTPNGDGVNDLFLPVTSDMVPADHELFVFDRWGQVVFDSTDPGKGWDGRHMNGGNVLPQGVYTWRLIERLADTSDKTDWFGTITLLK